MTTKILISPDQLTVTSEQGTFNFFEIKTKESYICKKCWFLRAPIEICDQIPCSCNYRKDGKNGYFSIHEMP